MGQEGARTVTAVTPAGVASGFGAQEIRLFDEVDGYVHLDFGVGYKHGPGNLRMRVNF